MTDTLHGAKPPTSALDEPLVVVTTDGHVAPLIEAYRPHCPKKYLEAFDELAQRMVQQMAQADSMLSEVRKTDGTRSDNRKTTGHLDVHARLRDMDRDGVAGEVIFHGSAGGGQIPFNAPDITGSLGNTELVGVGRQMYNRWLADFCSVEPERHVGLAQLPMWDIEASVKELEQAAELGLRGVNFPAARREITPYEDPAWEPFWSACEDLGMVLANHGAASGLATAPAVGPAAVDIFTIEGVALARVSPVCRLVFGGVFERHPKLKLVQTEQPGWWFAHVLAEFDSYYIGFRGRSGLPKMPSEYCRTNYFIGSSFQAHFEAEGAVRDGVVDNIMWGSDYPHAEGTYHYFEDPDATPATRLAIRCTYSGIPGDAARAMLGENAVRVYGLDGDALHKVAARIGAPTLDELAQPVDERPSHWSLAFREHNSYH